MMGLRAEFTGNANTASQAYKSEGMDTPEMIIAELELHSNQDDLMKTDLSSPQP